MSKLIVSLSPHAHGTDTVERNMYGVIIALMPALLVSFYFFGLGSVIVTATSVAACVFFEWAISKYILKQERNSVLDGSLYKFKFNKKEEEIYENRIYNDKNRNFWPKRGKKKRGRGRGRGTEISGGFSYE